MKEIKIKNFSESTLRLYHYFKNQKGSQEIAKPITIEVLLRICQELSPKRILEIGGGLGTISRLLLEHSDAHIDIYEDNDFCIEKLKENLSRFESRYTIVDTYAMLPPSRDYDLMVIDGADKKVKGGIGTKTIWLYLHYLRSIKVVYIEGHRYLQRLQARKALASSYTYRLYDYADSMYDGKNQRGGSKIVCKPCNSKWRKMLNFMYWEIRVGRGLKNFLRYNYRKMMRGGR